MRSYLLLITFALLTACTVTTTTISHIRLSTGDLDTPQGESPIIAVNTIALPDYLLRDELMHRNGEFGVRYDSAQRWAEPLDIGIQRVVATRLAAGLDTRQVIRFPNVTEEPVDWTLDVRVAEFEADGAVVRLIAEAQFTGEGSPIVVRFNQRLPLSTSAASNADSAANAEDIAKAMSELLWLLCDELVQSLSAAG